VTELGIVKSATVRVFVWNVTGKDARNVITLVSVGVVVVIDYAPNVAAVGIANCKQSQSSS